MLRQAHHWLGLTVAAWLVVATVSGALLLFKDEYFGWRYPTLPDAPALIEPDPLVIDAILSSSDQTITTLGQPTESLPAYHAYYSDGSEALYHPITSEIVATWSTFDALPAFLFDLHVYMLLGETGHLLVGVAALAGTVNILLGSVIWARRRHIFRLRYLVPRASERRFLIRGHAAQGAVFGIALLVSLVSGAAMIFPDFTQNQLNATLGQTAGTRPTVRSVATSGSSVDWAGALTTFRNRFPEARLRFITPPAELGQPLVLRAKQPAELHPNGRSYLVINPETAAGIEAIDATEVGLGPAVYDALYPIHSGKTGWPGYRVLLALMSAALLFIAVSGTYLRLTHPATRQH